MIASQKLSDLASRYWSFETRETPLAAVLGGEPTPDAALFRESAADHARRYRAAGELQHELSAIDPAKLSPDERTTFGILQHELHRLRRLHEVDAHLRPSLFPSGPDFTTVFWSNSTTLSDAADAKLYVDRLATIPAYLADVQANLRAGHAKNYFYPRVVLASAMSNTRALIAGTPEASPWFGPLKRSLASGPNFDAERKRAEAVIRDELMPALKSFADLLAGELSDRARDSLSCAETDNGRDHYRVLVSWFTTTELGPEEIHQLGLNEVSRIRKEVERIAAEAGYGNDVVGYRRFLSTDRQFLAPSADRLLGEIQQLCKRIDRKIPAFFSRIPRITYGVESIPPAMAPAMPPAYAQPSPGDRSSAGVFWVSSLPEKCPSYLYPALAVHEAWPGHLMHIALMQETEELPMFRRHGAVKYTACVEGWALYCEQLGIEMGVYETPHHHYGRLEMEMWRAARLVVDTGLHWYGWSRDRAIEFMAARLTLSRDTIAAEVDRYAALPAQALGYQIGGLKFRALRARAQQALGEKFNLREFHELVMTCGAVPLPVLETLVDDWIGRQAKQH